MYVLPRSGRGLSRRESGWLQQARSAKLREWREGEACKYGGMLTLGDKSGVSTNVGLPISNTVLNDVNAVLEHKRLLFLAKSRLPTAISRVFLLPVYIPPSSSILGLVASPYIEGKTFTFNTVASQATKPHSDIACFPGFTFI